MSWSTIRLQVTTPLFNAGHDPACDQDTGIRVPSILGAMRFWFRAMAGAHVGPDLDALRYWEGRVFGRAANDTVGGRDDACSPLQWRIPRPPAARPYDRTRDRWLPSYGKTRDQDEDRWIVYLLGQGLADLRNCTLIRPFVAPGESFELWFRQRREDQQALGLALTALWLTCAFGGVGARTRRGFGGLRITGFEPNGVALPPPWDTMPLEAPVEELYPAMKRLSIAQVARSLKHFSAACDEYRKPTSLYRWADTPPYPVLGFDPRLSGTETTISGLGSDSFASWNKSLESAGRMWRLFRASEPTPGVPYRPQVKTPEWINVVNSDDEQNDQFPLGALGLPVNFKPDCSVNVLVRGEEARRASPLWIRPMPIGDRWRLFSFTFLSEFLPSEAPDTPDIQVLRDKRPSKHLVVAQTAPADLSLAWLRRTGARPPDEET